MKTRASFLLPFALVGLLLSGCASTPPAGKPSARKHVLDTQYMAAVEKAASRLPVTVIWVNPPTRVVEDSDNK